jgi:hypothetical protein
MNHDDEYLIAEGYDAQRDDAYGTDPYAFEGDY